MTDRSNIGITQVTQWRDEAQQTLKKAQKLCTAAQLSLEKTRQDLTVQLPIELDSAEHLLESYQSQYELVDKHIKNLKRLLAENVDRVFADIEGTLEPSLRQLDTTITRMRSIKVPSFVLTSEEIAPRTLLDFIATESIDIMKENINIYRTNCAKLKRLLLDEFQSGILNPFHLFSTQHGVINTEFDRLGPIQIEYRTAHGNILESKGVMGTTLKENQALENELVSLLQMLTNHYDQCNKAVELLSSESSNVNVNIEVLATDANELSEVFNDLTLVYEIVLTNESKSNKTFQQYRSYIDTCGSLLRTEIANIREFKVAKLPSFMLLLNESIEVLRTCSITDVTPADSSPCEIYSETIEQLVYHYSQFIDIFETKYLTELHHEEFIYPRKFLKRIDGFLNEELYRMQLEETNRRRSWLAKYGEFIPREFKLPGEDKMPTVVQVITEGLERIQKQDGIEKFNDGAEKQLLDLIRSLKRK